MVRRPDPQARPRRRLHHQHDRVRPVRIRRGADARQAGSHHGPGGPHPAPRREAAGMNVPQELVLAGGGVVLLICAAVAGGFRRHGQHARPGRDHDDDITVVSQPDRDDPDTWATEGDVTGFTPAAADLEQPAVTIVRLDPEPLQPLPVAPVRIGPYAPTAGCWTPHTDPISDEDVEGLRQRFAAVQGNRPTILPDLPDGHLTVTG